MVVWALSSAIRDENGGFPMLIEAYEICSSTCASITLESSYFNTVNSFLRLEEEVKVNTRVIVVSHVFS
jgi:hypothetical protein